MFRYPGSKARLASWIVSHFPSGYEDVEYCEPFVGAGWVWAAKKPSRKEVLSDVNHQVVNAWKAMTNPETREYLVWALSWLPHGRELFQNLARRNLDANRREEPTSAAVAFLAVQSMSFGGKGGPAGWAMHKGGRQHLLALVDRLLTLGPRLDTIQVRLHPYDWMMMNNNVPDVLWYIDPPYVGTEFYYDGTSWDESRHRWLAYRIGMLSGKFVLSYEDHPLVRELYSGYRIIERTVTRQTDNATGKERKSAQELLIMNF